METHKIQAQHLVKIYGKRKVVNDLSMEMQQGEVVGILGPNGAGKTTTFYMILGLAKPNEGKVLLDDKDITHHPLYRDWETKLLIVTGKQRYHLAITI